MNQFFPSNESHFFTPCVFNFSSVLWMCNACSTGTVNEVEVDIWYGQDQRFGELGNPQRQINILGNIHIPNDSCRVYYTLNGQEKEVDISLGSDLHRLAMEGDFNIDVERSELPEGSNRIKLFIEREGKELLTRTISFKYTSAKCWPLPYYVDWSKAGQLQDAVKSLIISVIDSLNLQLSLYSRNHYIYHLVQQC